MSTALRLPMTEQGLAQADAIVEADQLDRSQKIADVWSKKRKEPELAHDLAAVVKRFGT